METKKEQEVQKHEEDTKHEDKKDAEEYVLMHEISIGTRMQPQRRRRRA